MNSAPEEHHVTLDELLRTHRLVTAGWRIMRRGRSWSAYRVGDRYPTCSFVTLADAMTWARGERP